MIFLYLSHTCPQGRRGPNYGPVKVKQLACNTTRPHSPIKELGDNYLPFLCCQFLCRIVSLQYSFSVAMSPLKALKTLIAIRHSVLCLESSCKTCTLLPIKPRLPRVLTYWSSFCLADNIRTVIIFYYSKI